ncbi:unnamed protein product [Tilletia controversa]|nr:unnamed protein product [Tilletia controversa]
MSSVHSNSPGPGEADDSLEFSSEESIREAIATDLAKSLAVIAEMDGISVAVRDRMVTGAETYWGRQLEQRLEARAQLVAEHEAREAAAKAARDAQAQRELEAQQQLEASTKAALNVSNMALPNLPARRPTTPPCPSFSKYARAIRIWYRRHLFQWGQDGRDNKRFDLGVPNPEWWPQLKNDEDMRLKHIELQAAMDQLNSVTAAAVASTSSSAGRRGDNQQRKRPWQDDAAGSSKLPSD